MTTADHKAPHVWARTPAGIRCAFQGCDDKPDAAAIARLEADEAVQRTIRRATCSGTAPVKPGGSRTTIIDKQR